MKQSNVDARDGVRLALEQWGLCVLLKKTFRPVAKGQQDQLIGSDGRSTKVGGGELNQTGGRSGFEESLREGGLWVTSRHEGVGKAGWSEKRTQELIEGASEEGDPR